jgi:hypothetical protein
MTKKELEMEETTPATLYKEKTFIESLVRTLKKGDVIPREELETRLQMKAEDPAFGLKVLAFVKALEAGFLEAGISVTVCQVDGDVHVLSDAEARLYHLHGFQSCLRGMERHHEKEMKIDHSQLSGEESRRLDLQIDHHARAIAGLRKVINARTYAEIEMESRERQEKLS